MRPLVSAILLAPILFAQEQTHPSQVMGGMRTYTVHLPATYKAAQRRYPVIYWLHGYEAGADQRDAQLTAWTAKHDAIVIDAGPAETSGNFPLYLAELADRVDHTLRTLADREHRAVSGSGVAGFLALWIAANSPELVGSAIALSPARSAAIGPRGFEVDTVIDDLRIDHEALRTRLLNSGDISAALDFGLSGFADPLPRPKSFTHADPYPNFTVWGWQAISDRRQPGITLLTDVNPHGFHSAVREWLPNGKIIAKVRLTVTSPKLFAPGTSHVVTYLALATRKTRRVMQRADSQGRLTFELDGTETEVGIGAEAVLSFAGFELTSARWATAGEPVSLRVLLCNKGGARSTPSALTWESPTPGVTFSGAAARAPALAPGEVVALSVTFTARTALPGAVKIGTGGRWIEIPVYPPAPPAASFKIADDGDRDGHASPGEGFTLSLPDGPAELITADPCVDTSVRTIEDNVRYTRARIEASCEPGRTVRMLARTANAYAAIEFPIWYKLP